MRTTWGLSQVREDALIQLVGKHCARLALIVEGVVEAKVHSVYTPANYRFVSTMFAGEEGKMIRCFGVHRMEHLKTDDQVGMWSGILQVKNCTSCLIIT